MSISSNSGMQSINDILASVDKAVFEPVVPLFIKRSRFFVNTVGMREAPERLVLELFRETCFDTLTPADEKAAKELVPHEDNCREEIALLSVARGRVKRARRNHVGTTYFGPLYPELARNAWPRKQTERVVGFQLLEGPLAESVGNHASGYAEEVIGALYGKPRIGDVGPDIFRELLDLVAFDPNAVGLQSREDATGRLAGRLKDAKYKRGSIGENDPLAKRISDDFLNLCRLEGRVPRLFWLDLLKCFLRLSLPTWLLAEMRLTVHLRDWAVTSLSGGFTSSDTIRSAIETRWEGLFHPTQTGTNEILLHIERYVKARVELSLIAHLVQVNSGLALDNSKLTLEPGSKDTLSIDDWLGHCRASGLNLGLPRDSGAVKSLLVPASQTFGAWLNPSTKGQGKNIQEFLRILLRLSAAENDDGYLFTGTAKGFNRLVVFPGPAMLRTMLYLTAARRSNGGHRGRGKLILLDLEEHFSEYGVDFGASLGARPKLISELARLGLLKGSPDAGDSAELYVPVATNGFIAPKV